MGLYKYIVTQMLITRKVVAQPMGQRATGYYFYFQMDYCYFGLLDI